VNLQVLANIDVDDLARATDFYCSAFELTVGRRFGSSAVELLGASALLYLLQQSPGSRISPSSSQQRDYTRHWTPVHLDFVVEDIAAALLRAQSAGARLEGEMRTYEWGRIATLADPFGNGFCLIEFLGGGYDEIAT